MNTSRMNVKKVLVIAVVALAAIAAGFGLMGACPAASDGGGAAGGDALLLGDGGATPRIVYLSDSASYRDDDDFGEGYERSEREDDDHEDDDHEAGEHDDHD